MGKIENTAGSLQRWPEGAIVYHIYPRSFQDSDDDGVGDLQGIIGRLDYVASLGVNAIWLSPFYPSPMADFGYDIADYCDIDPLFGTLTDFKQLLSSAAERNIKVIIDLVPNHTSDEHAWFQESCQSRTNPKADWYIWRNAVARDDHDEPIVPNNWLDALTGRSAWQWNEQRQQFYLHSFDAKQPDLNWTNPQVREAFKDVMRFWLAMGVDGFRVDAVYWMAKEPLLSDDEPRPSHIEGKDLRYEALLHNNSRGWPAIYAYLSEMCDVLKETTFESKPRFMVTEAYPERHNPLASYLQFYVGMDPVVAAPFNFEGVSLPWEARAWHDFLRSFHAALQQLSPLCVASYAFGNHDQSRLASRLGADSARSVAVMLLTLPGMVFIYYGEELGMEDVVIPPQSVRDPAALGDPEHGIGRDPERTPMQWTPGKLAGFSGGESTWLPLADDYQLRNVEIQSADPHSILSLYRTLGKLRNESETLRYGELHVLESGNTDVLAYIRNYEPQATYAVYVNFSSQPALCQLVSEIKKLVISSAPDSTLRNIATGEVTLRPYEAAVFLL
jgi:alpha-glucosidase